MSGPPTPGADDEGASPASDADGNAEDVRLPERPQARLFPGWLLIPLGGAAGWIVSGWGGGAFGCAVGLMIWRSRLD